MVTTRSSNVDPDATAVAGSAKPRRSAATSASSSTHTAIRTKAWTHAPSRTTLVWLAISLPLVIWDTGYVLLRPLSMPGGSLHKPIWAPYELYGTVDHMYGFKQWEAGNGFTAAQGSLNVVETLMYLVYAWLYLTYGRADGAGAKTKKTLSGRVGAWAALLGFSAAVMTVSKTVLYWLNEAYSGFDNIGHNEPFDLLLLWIIPNGAWLVFPSIMIYEIGADIMAGLEAASGVPLKSE